MILPFIFKVKLIALIFHFFLKLINFYLKYYFKYESENKSYLESKINETPLYFIIFKICLNAFIYFNTNFFL